MSEQVVNRAEQIIIRLLDGVEAAGQFVAAEAPEVVRQMLTFHLWEAVIGLVFQVVILFGIYKGVKFLIKNEWQLEDFSRSMVIVITLLMGFIFVIETYSNILTVLKITVAPSVYLIEYAAKLAGN